MLLFEMRLFIFLFECISGRFITLLCYLLCFRTYEKEVNWVPLAPIDALFNFIDLKDLLISDP